MTWPTCGARRGEAVEAVARRRRPDSLVVRGGWDGIDRFSDGLRARGWRLTSLRPPGVAYSVCRREPPRRGGAGGHGA